MKKIGVGWRIDKWAWMSFVSFSPDGAMVAADAATSRDDLTGDLTLWRFPSGEFVKRLPGRSAAISPDWKYYATDKDVRSLETGAPVYVPPKVLYPGFVFSPDSRYVAVILSGKRTDSSRIRIIELATGRQVSAFSRHVPGAVAFSPDGSTLAAGYWDAIAFWDVSTGKRTDLLSRFERAQDAYGGQVNSLGFSRDGKLLVVDAEIDGMRVFDWANHKQIHHFSSIGGILSIPAFSSDGELLAVGEYGVGTVWLIDTKTWNVVDHKRVSDMGCGSVDFSPDGHFLITPSTGGLITWPYDRGGTVRVFEVVR